MFIYLFCERIKALNPGAADEEVRRWPQMQIDAVGWRDVLQCYWTMMVEQREREIMRAEREGEDEDEIPISI
jgi:hypothetical protein